MLIVFLEAKIALAEAERDDLGCTSGVTGMQSSQPPVAGLLASDKERTRSAREKMEKAGVTDDELALFLLAGCGKSRFIS
jgi:hypothetical protein